MLLVGLSSTGLLSSSVIGFLLKVLLCDKNSTDEVTIVILDWMLFIEHKVQWQIFLLSSLLRQLPLILGYADEKSRS